MSVVNPFSRPATSLMKNHRCSEIHPRGSGVECPKNSPPEMKGMVSVPIRPVMVGDWVMVPSPCPTKISLDRNRHNPGAMRLMAMPATTWSTPKVMVARPRSRPPSAPPMPPHSECRPGAPQPAGPSGEPGAEDHHALEADVHDAGPLGPQAAQAGQEDGRRRADGGGEGGPARHVRRVGDRCGRRTARAWPPPPGPPGAPSGDEPSQRSRPARSRCSDGGDGAHVTAPAGSRLGAARAHGAGRVPDGGGGGEAAHDLEGDDGRQQQRPLQDLDDLLGHADRGQRLPRPFERRPHDGGDGDAARGCCARAGRRRCR